MALAKKMINRAIDHSKFKWETVVKFVAAYADLFWTGDARFRYDEATDTFKEVWFYFHFFIPSFPHCRLSPGLESG